MRNFYHISSGDVFDNWTVITKGNPITGRNGQTYLTWQCKCTCGTIKELPQSNLTQHYSRSCGCQQKAKANSIISKQNKLLIKYKANAKERGLNVFLTAEQLWDLSQQPCFYCNASPNNNYRKLIAGIVSGPEFKYNGIDRIDNTKDYTLNNCVTCCIICNRAKCKMTQEQFTQWLANIIETYFNRTRSTNSV